MSRKKIAVLIGQADEEQQSRFISGFLKQSRTYDYDVCVFSMHRKYQNTESREIGDSGIYQLINFAFFDAVVFVKDTIQTMGVADSIEKKLAAEFEGPVLCTDATSEAFPSIWVDGYTPVYQLISHLIEKHHKTDIGYLTGKKWHKHSQQRLRAFEDAMRDHDLKVQPNRVFYGDFWYTSGNAVVEQLLRKGEQLPEAIACANDQMAIGLCRELTAKGIRVPEDVAVVGFDSINDGRQSPKPITSAYTQQDVFGKRAADSIRQMLRGLGPDRVQPKPRLFIGETCGCDSADYIAENMFRKHWDTEISKEGYLSPFCTIQEDLFLQEDMTAFLNTVYSYIYQLGDIRSFDLCLNSDVIKGPTGKRRLQVYSDKMYHALSYDCVDQKDKMISVEETFDVSEMLPDLLRESKDPRAYFFVPIFVNDFSFGYAAVSYNYEPRSYDEVFESWIKTVSYGLEMMRKKMKMQRMVEKSGQQTENTSKKFPDRVTEKDADIRVHERNLSEREKLELEEVERILDGNSLEYHFQPIVDAHTGDIYSYEALMRPKSALRISPLAVIKYADMLDRLADVEKSTFVNILGLIGQNEQVLDGKFIFINSIPGTKMSEEDQAQIRVLLQKHAEKSVVELTEQAELDDAALDELKDQMRSLGIGIAVDDYGTGYSNVSNLLRYMPDYVKIDRSLLSGIHTSPQKQHFVREIIEFCHANGIKALAEGVETTEELHSVIILGADLIQGYYTAKPNAVILPEINETIKKEIIAYQNERKNGSEIVYEAGKTNRISLSELAKGEYSSIVVGSGRETYRDITITGAPGLRTKIHINICSDYYGCITIEDCDFSSKDNCPTIDIGEHCDVVIVLKGENRIRGGGIRVPESSRLTFEGNGNLQINLSEMDFFGIGNGLGTKCGDLEFYQDGLIAIQADGDTGIGIGAGLGGNVRINRGMYSISTNASKSVGIGAFDAPVELAFSNCSIEIDNTTGQGVGVGSFNNNAKLVFSHLSMKCYVQGKDVTALGTMKGENAEVTFDDLHVHVEARAKKSATIIGSMMHNTSFSGQHMTLRATGYGDNALGFGGVEGETTVFVKQSDVRVDLMSQLEQETFAKDENLKIEESRYQVRINGNYIEARSFE